MTNVHLLNAHTNMTVEEALNYALKEPLTDVLILAYNPEGQLVTRSSHMTRKDALWLTEQARLHILDVTHNADL